MATRAELLAKIANAKSTGGGVYMKPGQYILEVENVLLEEKYGGTMVICEFLVREAIDSGERDSSNGQVIEANKVGTRCSVVDNISKPGAAGDAAAGNVKAFACALFGEDVNNVSPQDFIASLEAITAKDQPARGMLIGCSAFTKPKKTKPGEFLVAKRWTTIENADADVAARRAAQAQGSKAA